MYLSDSSDAIQIHLLDWFDTNGRHWIPWKLHQNGTLAKPGQRISPYGIWIAEVMLQQTKLQVVLPYWRNWMKSFPTLNDLAKSEEHDVLLQWQGLGYYSRAKRIFYSSKLLINLIGKNHIFDISCWPTEVSQWMLLPGIGRTTAGSIISSAFDLPAPILDGNVKRIFSRLIANYETTTKAQKKLWELSFTLLSKDRPRDFNQALMDLGTKVCTPQKPSCSFCPLQNFCDAYINYNPIDFPKKEMKKIISLQKIGIGIVFNNIGEVLIDQRLESSSMGGMWEFPGGKKMPDESIKGTIKRELKEELGIIVKVGEKLLSFEHAYTHKKLYFTVHLCELVSGEPKPLASQKLLWVSPENLIDFPFPAANTKIISELHQYLSNGKKTLNH
tara:strand:+ start:676 stop:1836 length:1161 start_codon:yes stop_codon:yes gene_type:complete